MISDYDYNNDNDSLLVSVGIKTNGSNCLEYNLLVDHWKLTCTEELEKELQRILGQYEEYELDDDQWKISKGQSQEIEIIKAVLKRREN